jgi:lipoate-protein ligase A
VRPWLPDIILFDDTTPHSAPLNMAIDEALLAVIPAPLLRIYRWSAPALSFGYFQPWEPIRAAYPTRALVRRWTGGGLVLHGQDLTYSLLIPSSIKVSGPADSYRLIHTALARALNDCQIPAQPAPSSSQKTSPACFENPVLHDILVQNRKVAGAAQRRTRTGLLHQGSIQTLNLPATFPTRFASHLAPAIQTKSFNVTEAAEHLAATKYATQAWLQKHHQ